MGWIFRGQPGALLGYRETFGLPGDNTFGATSPPTDADGLDGFATDLMVADGHWLLLQNVPLGPLTHSLWRHRCRQHG